MVVWWFPASAGIPRCRFAPAPPSLCERGRPPLSFGHFPLSFWSFWRGKPGPARPPRAVRERPLRVPAFAGMTMLGLVWGVVFGSVLGVVVDGFSGVVYVPEAPSVV